MAGMLLADLGADVIRAAATGPARQPAPGPVASPSAVSVPPAEGASPEALAWDRGKRYGSAGQLSQLAALADVVLSDAPWEEGIGLATAHAGRAQVRVWMPPHTSSGRFAGLPDDPVLRSALGGFAAHHPSVTGRPVASVVPTFTAVHAAIGASAAAAGLLRVQAAGTAGDTVVVSGLHAMAACLCSMAITGLDVEEVYSSGTRIPGAPNFRAYQASDGRWLYLAALSPDFFLRALTVLDRIDVMLLPGIDGEFTSLLVPRTGAQAGDELEKTFATRTCAEWIEDLTAAGIPAAPVATRAEWLAGPYHDGLVTMDHPVLGPVTMPGIPVRLSATPGQVGALPPERALPSVPATWLSQPSSVNAAGPAAGARANGQAGPGGQASAYGQAGPGGQAGAYRQAGPGGHLPAAPQGRPLAGLRVVDLSTFLAAPFVSSLLADYGAEVIKIERPGGDPYRVFAASYAAINQRKTVATLDLRDPAAAGVLTDLLREADVLVDNTLGGGLDRLGLGEADLAAVNPGLVRCSVSAFGPAGAHASLPGFDPILQSLSGLAAVQGGADQGITDPSLVGEPCVTAANPDPSDANPPVTTSAPVHDVAAGLLGALGVLAALFERERPAGGREDGTRAGQHVTASLAASAGFLQLAEMTTYAGRPPAAIGGIDYPGPSPLRRLYRAADGWLAVAAITGEQVTTLLSITGTADPAGLTGPDGLAGALAELFAGRPVEHWLDLLAEYEIPACPVVERQQALWGPWLGTPDSGSGGLTHVVRDPRIGRLRVAATYADWAAVHEGQPSPSAPGGDWRSQVTERVRAAGTVSPPFAVP
jgi:crotonobetainyl-CoA:carnitine CoA-transferase CaiB-like acyl-CoA transferase